MYVHMLQGSGRGASHIYYNIVDSVIALEGGCYCGDEHNCVKD